MRVNACPRQGCGGSLIKRILEDSFTETVCTACARAVGAEGQLKARAVPVDDWLKDAQREIRKMRRKEPVKLRRGKPRPAVGLLKQSSSWASVSFVLSGGCRLSRLSKELKNSLYSGFRGSPEFLRLDTEALATHVANPTASMNSLFIKFTAWP